MPYDPAVSWDGTSWFGAGLKAMERIGAAKGKGLVGCDALTVEGDVAFGRDVVVRGTVRLTADGDGQRRIPDGAVL